MSQLLQQIRSAQIRAGEDAVIANLQSMGLARTERDRPSALAASEASHAAIKRENALRDAAPELLTALQGLVAVLDRQLHSPHAAARASPLGRARSAIAKATGDTP